MRFKNHIDQSYNLLKYVKLFVNKELLLGFFFLIFVLGIDTGISRQSYNDFRALQVVILLALYAWSLIYRNYSINKVEIALYMFVVAGVFFWQQPLFIIADIALIYLLFKIFQFSNYQNSITKTIVLSSLTMFLLLPLAIWDYINTGVYRPNWYLFSLNIRVYDSYFLIVTIFSIWLYLTENKYKNLYLLFPFLAFLAILLDSGRSVTISYTVFVAIISVVYRNVRWQIISVYASSWLTYLLISYFATSSQISEVRVLRVGSSGRFDLLMNAYYCWLQNPLIGCGFYQLDNYRELSAHPHNLYFQVLSETGIIGLSFLLYIIIIILKRIDWQQRSSYFVVSSLLAISVDSAFSGSHVYPITQMAILWLFILLLKNPYFSHSKYFTHADSKSMRTEKYLSYLIYCIIFFIFFYIFIHTFAFTDDTMSIPPRFWINGYSIL